MSRRRVKRGILAAAALAMAALLGWRLWPHSLSDVMEVDAASLDSLSCSASVSGLRADGTAYIDSYVLQPVAADGEAFRGVMEILSAARYRQDFRNLLPWPVTEVGSDRSYDGRSAAVSLVWGDAGSEGCGMSFLSGGTVSVRLRTEEGFRIYHPTDPEVLGRLVEYVQDHGAPN